MCECRQLCKWCAWLSMLKGSDRLPTIGQLHLVATCTEIRMSVDFAPLRRQTVPEQVATTIRAKILNGELPPGHRLREVELAEKLAVSRGVLREAFRLLA